MTFNTGLRPCPYEPRWRARVRAWDSNAQDDLTGSSPIALHTSGEWNPPVWALPKSVSTQGIVVVLYGALFNGRSIARKAGHDSTHGEDPDLMAIAAGYHKWGESLFRRLRGYFCILIVDPERRVTLCARDHMGTMPVFYADLADQGVVVSSAFDGLLFDPKVPKDIDRFMFAGLLIGLAPEKEETFFQAIRRVPAGSFLRHSRSGITIDRYWRPEEDSTFLRISAIELQEAFSELFKQAVHRCTLVGASPGILLSGGLDSVSVAAFATDALAGKTAGRLQAFSLIFPHADCNEESIQTQIAKELGIGQRLFTFDDTVGEQGLLRASLKLTGSWPMPLDNVWYGAYQHLHGDASTKGCDVLLTGGGGDEWLNVTPLFAADLLRAGSLVELHRFWITQRGSVKLNSLALARNLLWRHGLRPIIRTQVFSLLARRQSRLLQFLQSKREKRAKNACPPWLLPEPEWHKPFLDRLAERWAARVEKPRFDSYYFEDVAVSLDHPLVSMEKEEQYIAGRRSQCRFLEPFYDPDLVGLLYRAHPTDLMAKGRSKAMVRYTVEQRFPGLGFANQKKVLASRFWRDIVMSQAPQCYLNLGGFGALATEGVIDRRGGQTYLESAFSASGDRDHRAGARIWAMLNLETWLRGRGVG